MTEACQFEKAMDRFKAGDYVTASALFVICEAGEEYQKESAFFHAISLRHLGQTSQAIEQFERARVLDPANLNVLNEQAVTYEQSQQLLKAQQAYEKVLAVEPHNFAAQLGVARMLHWRGKIVESIKRYQALQAREPDKIPVKLGLGFALVANYALVEARQLFDSVLLEASDNSSALSGIDMLNKITKNQLQLKHQFNTGDSTQIKSTSLYYKHQKNHKSSWGASYLYNDLGINPILENGIRENRTVNKELALFTAYQFTPKFNGMLKIANRFRSDNKDIIKSQYELGYRFNNSLSGHFGQVNEWSSGNLLNILTFTGVEYVKPDNFNLSAQVYYSSDDEFGDSQSLSLKYKKYFSKKSWGQVGVSQRFATNQKATTVFGKYSWRFNKNTSVFIDAVANLEEHQSSVGLGINHAF